MAYSTLDEQLIVSGLNRASGGSADTLIKRAFQFFGLTANQQENQIRQEALTQYNETQTDIANLNAKLTALEAQAAILLARSQGNQ